MQVVLVEDNDGDAYLVEDALRSTRSDVVVRRAVRLGEGLALAADHADLVLLDLSLPDSRGLETVARAVDRVPTAPIVVLTGSDDSQLAEHAVQLGAQDYLVKGRFDAEMLERAIRYAIERHEAMQELRATNEELAAANEELARANERKDDFIAIASHELRTPVAVIGGAIQTLVARTPDADADQRGAMLAALGRQSERLLALVEDLLVLARLDRDAIGARRRPVDLRTVALAAVDASCITTDDVHVDVPQRTVVTDEEYLTRILVNLLDNAAKYGAAPVEVDTTESADGIIVRVRDHGRGIDADIESRLFERFVRSTAPEVRRESGTGLGLAIVQALASTLDATVVHEQPAGGGASFSLRLPTSASADAPPGASPARRPEKVIR